MQTQDFASFVASQQEPPQNLAADNELTAEEIRQEWLHNLDKLYAQVAEMLREFVDNGAIRFNFTDVTLHEEELGSYTVKKMEIQIGRKLVVLEPVGTLIVGSKGRVDIIGSAGRTLLLLVRKSAKSAKDLIKIDVSLNSKLISPNPPPSVDEESAWKIVQRGIQTSFVDVDKDSFFALLMELSGA